MMKNLEEIRQEINLVDEALVKLLERRLDAVTQVAEYKIAHQLPVFDSKREVQVLEKIAGLVEKKDYQKAILSTFQDMMNRSKEFQQEYLKDKGEK